MPALWGLLGHAVGLSAVTANATEHCVSTAQVRPVWRVRAAAPSPRHPRANERKVPLQARLRPVGLPVRAAGRSTPCSAPPAPRAGWAGHARAGALAGSVLLRWARHRSCAPYVAARRVRPTPSVLYSAWQGVCVAQDTVDAVARHHHAELASWLGACERAVPKAADRRFLRMMRGAACQRVWRRQPLAQALCYAPQFYADKCASLSAVAAHATLPRQGWETTRMCCLCCTRYLRASRRESEGYFACW